MTFHITKWKLLASHGIIMASDDFSRNERWMSWKALDSHRTNMIVGCRFSCNTDESILVSHRMISFGKLFDE